MKDPVKDPGEWTDFERRLLDAAASDQIPPDLKAKMAEGLTASTLVGAAATSGTSLLLSKAVVVGVASALLAGGAVGWSLLRGEAEVRVARPEAPAIEPSVPQPPAAGAEPVPSEPIVEAAAPLPAAMSGNALKQEIALIDACRQAVKQKAPARAIDLLARYDKRFPNGTLVPEAEALRIEALLQLGAAARARALADKFLAAYPASPLAQRVERMAGAR